MKNLIDQKIQELARSLSKRLSMEITASTASSTIKLHEELRITIFLLEKAIQDYSKAPSFSLAINRNHPLHIDNDYVVKIWLLSPLVVLYPTTIIYSFLDLLLGITLKEGINLTAILLVTTATLTLISFAARHYFAEYHNVNKIDELLFEYQALVHEIKKNKAPPSGGIRYSSVYPRKSKILYLPFTK